MDVGDIKKEQEEEKKAAQQAEKQSFFSSLFSNLFKSSNPEAEKKRKLKAIAKPFLRLNFTAFTRLLQLKLCLRLQNCSTIFIKLFHLHRLSSNQIRIQTFTKHKL